jgi:hypothetical protein
MVSLSAIFLRENDEHTCWYDTMRESNDTVLPVPDGISKTQCPYTIRSFVGDDVLWRTSYGCIKGSLQITHVRILFLTASSGKDANK